jgi:hypothetical protein
VKQCFEGLLHGGDVLDVHRRDVGVFAEDLAVEASEDLAGADCLLATTLFSPRNL